MLSQELSRRFQLRRTGLPVLTLLIAGCILMTALFQGSSTLLQNGLQDYGQGLSRQLASEASTLLIRNDQAGLNALAYQLSQAPMVTGAAIYDLDNQPISQHGVLSAPGLINSSHSIHLQDTLAGYAVVSLTPERQSAQLQQLFGYAIALLLLLALLAARILYEQNARLFSTLEQLHEGLEQRSIRQLPKTDREPLLQQLLLQSRQLLRKLPNHHQGMQGALCIALQWRSGECPDADSWKKLEKLCQLYGADHVPSAPGWRMLELPIMDEAESLFHALCCALQLQRLLGGQLQGVGLDLQRHELTWQEWEREKRRLLGWRQAQQAAQRGRAPHVGLTPALAAHEVLLERCDNGEQPEKTLQIARLASGPEALLANQLQRLQE